MFTDAFLEFFRCRFGHELTVLRQCKDQTPAQCIENESVGNRVHDTTGDRADPRKRLEAISGNRQ